MQTVTAAFSQHLHHLTDHNQNMQRLSFRNTNNIKKKVNNNSKYQKETS